MPNIQLDSCQICPRKCGADRFSGKTGYCRASYTCRLALATIHHGEEPPISGTNGSGAVFFSHCNLRCLFCQNFEISQKEKGTEVSVNHLAEIFLSLQRKKVHNINLVSPTHYVPQIKEALIIAKEKGLVIPIVYNSNGYDSVESLQTLEGLIDIYLPDIKYYDDKYAIPFSNAPNYFINASLAVQEMFRQTGEPEFDKNGIMKKGIIIRHLILPGCRKDSEKILQFIYETFQNKVFVSLLNQYTPMYASKEHPQLKRRLTTFEYQKTLEYFFSIGLKNGFMQKKTSATEAYTPCFDLSGLLLEKYS